jgi:prepilin-type N-terminal cleavage/methylation domain-containing protein
MKLNKPFSNDHLTSKGFTLVEMAIVLIIFGLMLAMFLSPLSAQRDLQNRAKTQLKLNEIKAALIGYAIVNSHLPCTDTDAIPDGLENRDSSVVNECDSDKSGILPWKTLGIDGTDAWGNLFTYRVDATFSDNVNRFTINDAEGESGINVNDEKGAALVSTNSRPAALILSHGSNGFGALNIIQDSSLNHEPNPTSTDELENADNDVTFVSHPPAAPGSSNGEFDDMLIWISPKVLINRMIMAERLP